MKEVLDKEYEDVKGTYEQKKDAMDNYLDEVNSLADIKKRAKTNAAWERADLALRDT